MLFLCAFDTNFAPGSAIHGDPESDNKPKEIPLRHGAENHQFHLVD